MVARFCARISSIKTPLPRSPSGTFAGDARLFFPLTIGAPVYSPRANGLAELVRSRSRGGTAVEAATRRLTARAARAGPDSPHSNRSASVGLTDAARQAGHMAAASATRASTRLATAIVG